jgi:flagellar assembly protein FliH
MPSSPDFAVLELGQLDPAAGLALVRTQPVTPAPIFELGGTVSIPQSMIDSARDAARAAGYAEGWASGTQAARAQALSEAEVARIERMRAATALRLKGHTALESVERAATALERRAVAGAEQLEDLILSAALQIAEAVVGHALRDDAVRGRAALARVLALAPDREPVEVRLHPEDHELLTAGEDYAAGSDRTITLVADPRLQPGDAVALCGATEIDARISEGIARVRQALNR